MENIYKITNNETGKFYVGRSNNVKERLRKHKKMLMNGIHDNVYLQRAWDKYEGNFSSEIVYTINTGDAETDRQLAIAKEQEILDANVVGKTIYNMSPSALTGVRYGKDHHAYGKTPREFMGEEGYAKYLAGMSKAFSGENNPFYGKKHTEETIAYLRENCANYGEDNGFYGKKHTEETLETLRSNAKGKRVSVEGVVYRSIREAVRQTGYTRAIIKYRAPRENYDDFYYLED